MLSTLLSQLRCMNEPTKADYNGAAGANCACWHVVDTHCSLCVFAGVILLGNIAHGQALDEHANFDTFPAAMLTLFRVAVGDDWTSLMQASDGNIGVFPPVRLA